LKSTLSSRVVAFGFPLFPKGVRSIELAQIRHASSWLYGAACRRRRLYPYKETELIWIVL